MTKLYVLALNGIGPRKIHSPDCNWVLRTVKQPFPARPKRQYEHFPAGTVTGEPCRRCGGVPGPRH